MQTRNLAQETIEIEKWQSRKNEGNYDMPQQVEMEQLKFGVQLLWTLF